MEMISIIIPTYNRAKTLGRTLNSIEKQTVKDFVCIIVDDGSTDGTRNLIERLKVELTFPMEYYYQDNAGVLSARLLGIEKANTELIMLLDSDDEIAVNAVEIFLKTWGGLSNAEKMSYRGVGCPCRNYITGNILGGAFPEDINKCSYKEYFKAVIRGERFDVQRRDIILQQYREYELLKREANTSFVSEGTLHIKYNLRYRLYYINDALRIYHDEDSDSITRGDLTVEGCKNSYFSHVYILRTYFPNNQMPFKMYFSSAMYAVKFALLLKYSPIKVYKDVGNSKNRLVLTLAIPFGVGNFILGKKIKKK